MKILVLPGDGIGPEITDATMAALNALKRKLGLEIDFVIRDIGFAAHAESGSMLPDNILAEIDDSEGVILGPCDTYGYPDAVDGGVNPSMTLRKHFNLYANIRPSRVRDGIPATVKAMDLVIARENTEGFYADRNMVSGSGEFMPTDDTALAVRKITVKGSEQIARAAFELARTRRKKVTAVHKANVLQVSDGLFLDCVKRVGENYSDVELDDVLVDAMAAYLIRRPTDFDVVVTTNMFGDILSDQAAELSGGLGLGGSINAGDDRAMAQAAHGAAPDIAGQNVANPTALMLSVQMLFVWLANHHGDNAISEAAGLLEAAVDMVLSDPAKRTPDMGGKAGTNELGAAVAAAIEV